LRIAAKVDAGQNEDPVVLFQIEEPIRKAPQRCAPYLVPDCLIKAWHFGDEGLDTPYLGNESSRQSWPFAFVSPRRIGNFATR